MIDGVDGNKTLCERCVFEYMVIHARNQKCCDETPCGYAKQTATGHFQSRT